MCSFPVPRLSLGTSHSVVVHSLPAAAEGVFYPSSTTHRSSVPHRHSAKEKCLQRERAPCLSLLSIPSAGDNETALQRQHHSSRVWRFSMFICQNHQDYSISVSGLKSLQLNYVFLKADGGVESSPSLPNPTTGRCGWLQRESFTRRKKEGKET